MQYFVTEMLQPDDVLVVLTPTALHPIKISQDKLGLSIGLAKLLAADCREFQNKRRIEEKELAKNLARIEQLLQHYQFAEEGVEFLEILLSYKEFDSNWQSFKSNFAVASAEKYRQALASFAGRHGDCWWIHFQEREIVPLQGRVGKVLEQMQTVLFSRLSPMQDAIWRRVIETNVEEWKRHTLIFGFFPGQEIANLFQQQEVLFSTIYFSDQTIDKDAQPIFVFADQEENLSRLARQTGGLFLFRPKPEEALKEINLHEDSFYELSFPSPTAGPADFKVELANGGGELFYPAQFSAQEFFAWRERTTVSSVKILKLELERRQVSFSLSRFIRNGINDFGLLRVVLQIRSQGGELAFSSQKVLQASKAEILVAIPVSLIPGDYQLQLEVTDLIANTRVTEELAIAVK